MKKSEGEQKPEVLSYIKNEKDIARYKLLTLERIKNPSVSQKRVMDIEKEFISLPLEDICFEDLADVAAAISIYRTSRSQFFDIYKLNSAISFEDPSKNKHKKIQYLKNLSEDLRVIKPQEINYIQNTELYYELIKKNCIKNNASFDVEKKFLDGKDLKELLKIEPSILAKNRARLQASLYSLGCFIQKRLDRDVDLDKIIQSLDDGIFENYNDGILNLPNHLKNTMGHNDYISKLHPLQNLLDFENIYNKIDNVSPLFSEGFEKGKPLLGNILFGSKKAISISQEEDCSRNIQNKVFGILLPIPHEGNEKMSLLYKSIFIDGCDISHMFSDSISNIKASYNGEIIYCKAILMKPLWKLKLEVEPGSDSDRILSKLIGIDFNKFSELNLNEKSIIDKINNTHSGFINICSNSRVYSAKTRSEEEGLSKTVGVIKSKILEIKKEYSLIVGK